VAWKSGLQPRPRNMRNVPGATVNMTP
jgi:hypothetical protein